MRALRRCMATRSASQEAASVRYASSAASVFMGLGFGGAAGAVGVAAALTTGVGGLIGLQVLLAVDLRA